jgi:mannose-6-phosphate isomerase-like protein (cupin superfamily)
MGFVVRRIVDIPIDRGSCGVRRRIITTAESKQLGLSHLLIEDARLHRHRHTTEIYFILDGEGTIEIEEEFVPVSKGTIVLIPPNMRHRAISSRALEVLVIMSPALAEEGDTEYFD